MNSIVMSRCHEMSRNLKANIILLLLLIVNLLIFYSYRFSDEFEKIFESGMVNTKKYMKL